MSAEKLPTIGELFLGDFYPECLAPARREAVKGFWDANPQNRPYMAAYQRRDAARRDALDAAIRALP